MIRRRQSAERGQSLVELALVLPVLVLVLVGIMDLGRAVYAYNTISNASREAARVAIVNQTLGDVQAEAIKQSVNLGLTGADVSIAYGDPSGTGTCSAPYGVGCLASVTVRYTFTAATPVLGQIIGPFTMSASTEMPVERTCPDPSLFNLVTCPWP
jgi:Flp pilus assembly protein TadG